MADLKPRDPAERRRRVMLASMLILFSIGGGVLNTVFEHGAHWRTVDFVKIGAILTLAFVLALRSTTAIRLTPRNPALDDELTRANRSSAAGWGFWVLLLLLLAVFIANFTWPLAIAEILPFVLIAGAATAGLRFVFLERRGAKG